jgi:hypothetical protein
MALSLKLGQAMEKELPPNTSATRKSVRLQRLPILESEAVEFLRR